MRQAEKRTDMERLPAIVGAVLVLVAVIQLAYVEVLRRERRNRPAPEMPLAALVVSGLGSGAARFEVGFDEEVEDFFFCGLLGLAPDRLPRPARQLVREVFAAPLRRELDLVAESRYDLDRELHVALVRVLPTLQVEWKATGDEGTRCVRLATFRTASWSATLRFEAWKVTDKPGETPLIAVGISVMK
jgi:hypothetical protein